MRYSLNADVRAAFEACDLLGFDTVREAACAVLNHDDWQDRWEADSTPGRGGRNAGVIDRWREYTLDQNDTRGRCPDCGQFGELRGHMTCQYPSEVRS